MRGDRTVGPKRVCGCCNTSFMSSDACSIGKRAVNWKDLVFAVSDLPIRDSGKAFGDEFESWNYRAVYKL